MDDPEAFTAIFHATEGYRKFEEPKVNEMGDH